MPCSFPRRLLEFGGRLAEGPWCNFQNTSEKYIMSAWMPSYFTNIKIPVRATASPVRRPNRPVNLKVAPILGPAFIEINSSHFSHWVRLRAGAWPILPPGIICIACSVKLISSRMLVVIVKHPSHANAPRLSFSFLSMDSTSLIFSIGTAIEEAFTSAGKNPPCSNCARVISLTNHKAHPKPDIHFAWFTRCTPIDPSCHQTAPNSSQPKATKKEPLLYTLPIVYTPEN